MKTKMRISSHRTMVTAAAIHRRTQSVTTMLAERNEETKLNHLS